MVELGLGLAAFLRLPRLSYFVQVLTLCRLFPWGESKPTAQLSIFFLLALTVQSALPFTLSQDF